MKKKVAIFLGIFVVSQVAQAELITGQSYDKSNYRCSDSVKLTAQRRESLADLNIHINGRIGACGWHGGNLRYDQDPKIIYTDLDVEGCRATASVTAECVK